MNHFESLMQNPSNKSLETVKKDGGVIYKDLLATPATLKMENGRAASLCHIGHGEDRTEQQDRIVFGPNGMASIDGMGGEGNFGGVAAQILAEEMQKGFAEGLKPEDIHHNAFLRIQEANIGKSGACYMAFKMNGRTLNAFSAGDVKIAVASQKGELKYESIKYESIGEKSNDDQFVTNALQGTKEGVCRLHGDIELDDEDRIFMGSDGFWNQFPGGVMEVAKLAKGLTAEKAVIELNQVAMERMTSGKPDVYEDNLNIIVYDFNASFGKGEPSLFVKLFSGKPEEEESMERKGILEHIKDYLKKAKDFLVGEKVEEIDWSKVQVDTPRRRRILDHFENKEGTWDHDLSYFEKEDPEQAKKEEDLMKRFATGEIGANEISHFLRGIKAPIGEEEDPLVPKKIFKDISRFDEGAVLSMTKLISELAGTPNETLTIESLGQFLVKYPDPTLLKDRIMDVITTHIAENDTRDFVKWPEFTRATLWALYGKRAKYAEQITLLYGEAEKKHPEMANLEDERGTEEVPAFKNGKEGNLSNLRERILETQYASELTPLYIESVENIFKKLRDESGGNLDEKILIDKRFHEMMRTDELRMLAHHKLAELTANGEFYNIDEELLALAHVMHGKESVTDSLDFSKIKNYPYGVEQ